MLDPTTGAAASSRSAQAVPNSVNWITCWSHPTTTRALSRLGATRPARPQRKFNKTIDLEKLQDLADALVKDQIPNDPQAQQVQDLMLLGTSMGGARPKAVVQGR